jgi:hypothetical protein
MGWHALRPRGVAQFFAAIGGIQPESGRAHLGLGSALVAVGDLAGAIPHLEKAAADSDPAVREAAAQTLPSVGKVIVKLG